MIVGRRVGPEGESVFVGGLPQIVEHAAGPNPPEAILRIDLEDVIEVFREIDDDGDVAALTGKARPPAARENRRAELTRDRDRIYDIVQVPRDNNANRRLAIVRAIGRVKRAAAVVETHFALDSGAKCFRQGRVPRSPGRNPTCGCGDAVLFCYP
jgi:hypothetical protein